MHDNFKYPRIKKIQQVHQELQTENAERHTFKAPCCCFENAPYTIVCTINVSIVCKKNEVPNLLLEKNIFYCLMKTKCCFVFKLIVCEMMISLSLQLECTMMYRVTTRNGIDCCNNPTLLIWLVTTHFDWMGLNCYIYACQPNY